MPMTLTGMQLAKQMMSTVAIPRAHIRFIMRRGKHLGLSIGAQNSVVLVLEESMWNECTESIISGDDYKVHASSVQHNLNSQQQLDADSPQQ